MPYLSYLLPVAVRNRSAWYGVRPHVALIETLMLLGLIGLGLGSAVWRADTGKLAPGLLAVGLLLATVSVGMLIAHAPPSWQSLRDRLRSANGIVGQDAAVIPYTPACAVIGIPVCMHPAYRKYLQGDAATIRRLLRPLRGIPGAPIRAMQTPGRQGVSNGTLDFILSNLPPDDISVPDDLANDQSFFGPIIRSIVQAQVPSAPCPGDATQRSCNQAQEAVGIWLVWHAGLRIGTVDPTGGSSYPFVGRDSATTSAAAHRFALLPASHQHAWLLTHYLSLRHGSVPITRIP